MAQIIWTEPALSDLDAIADYIALDKPEGVRLTNHMVGGVVAGPGFDGWLFPGEPRRRR
jgi:hypothetical protein